MKTSVIYEEIDGKVVRIKGRVHRASRELEDFDTRMKRTLYQLECDKGSRFRVPEFSKNQLKKVWGRL